MCKQLKVEVITEVDSILNDRVYKVGEKLDVENLGEEQPYYMLKYTLHNNDKCKTIDWIQKDKVKILKN